jgi:cytochrome b561
MDEPNPTPMESPSNRPEEQAPPATPVKPRKQKTTSRAVYGLVSVVIGIAFIAGAVSMANKGRSQANRGLQSSGPIATPLTH